MSYPWRMALAGVGNVGRELLRLLAEQEATGTTPVRVVGLATRRSGLRWRRDGWDAAAAIDAQDGEESASFAAWLEATGAQILVELLPQTDDAEPALSLIRTAILGGVHVVTANKAPLAHHGEALESLAHVHDRELRYGATVLDAVPLRAMLAALPHAGFTHLRGVVNSTSGVVLDALAAGRSVDDGIAEARRLGIAEADVTRDLDGTDAALKLVILARLVFGSWIAPASVFRQGVPTGGSLPTGPHRLVVEAEKAGDAITARVSPQALSPDDPLATLRGTGEGVVLRGERMGVLCVTMPAPVVRDTALGVLHDVMTVVTRGAVHPRPRV